jgi:serine phosphatase RsbU (regulator of sigma subunit)
VDVVAASKEIIKELRNKVPIEKVEILESVGVDFCFLKINLSNKEIQYANFNSNIIVMRGEEFIPVSKSKGFFRMLQFEGDIENGVLQAQGLRVVLFSDGLVDLMGGPNNKRLKMSGVEQWVKEESFFQKGPQHLSAKIKEYLGPHDQIDDITLLSFQC